MIRLEGRVAHLEQRSGTTEHRIVQAGVVRTLTPDDRIDRLEQRLDAAQAWIGIALDDGLVARVAELEKLVAMMRHAIDVAVLTQFSAPTKVLPDIGDSPLSPADNSEQAKLDAFVKSADARIFGG